MNKTSKTKKQQIVLIFLGMAAVIAALWYVVIKSQETTLASVQKKTAEMKDKVAKGEKLLKMSAEVEATLEAETKTLETIESGMASGDIYSWVINVINQFEGAKRVTFLDYQREIISDVGLLPNFPYKAAIFPVKGTGYFPDFGKFLAEFENNFPYVRVQNLELVPSTKSGAEDIEKLNFKFEIVALIKPAGQ
ncbi:MAG: hypothetical protein ABI042_09535 [Verrucomicrobiota bacterium]